MASGYYLQLDGVTGGCRTKGHVGWIGVESLGWGNSQSGMSTKGPPSSSQRVVHLTKRSDKSSQALFHLTATGSHIAKGVIEIAAAPNSLPRLVLVMTDILVASFQVEQGVSEPADMFTLLFSQGVLNGRPM